MKQNTSFLSYIIYTAIAILIGYSAIQYISNEAKELTDSTASKIAEIGK